MALIHRIELKKILHFQVEIAEFILEFLRQSIELSQNPNKNLIKFKLIYTRLLPIEQ